MPHSESFCRKLPSGNEWCGDTKPDRACSKHICLVLNLQAASTEIDPFHQAIISLNYYLTNTDLLLYLPHQAWSVRVFMTRDSSRTAPWSIPITVLHQKSDRRPQLYQFARRPMKSHVIMHPSQSSSSGSHMSVGRKSYYEPSSV